MARRMAGGGSGQGNTTYLPLKVNFSGVMPIIFTSAILSILSMVLQWIPFTRWLTAFIAMGSVGYMVIYAIMIMLFSYFWVANMFNPIQTADNLKREGAYIPGIRPGQPTADFLDSTMTRITFAGSLFLTALALFPMVLYSSFQIPFVIASFFGGTSLLIIVGVLLDTLSQMESHLVMRNYDGFLKKGKVKNRR
jgi:preprotein translocase subunit SecY